MLSNGQTWTLIGALIGLCTFVMGAMFAGLRSEIGSLRGEMGLLRDELKADIRAETATLHSETATLRAEMQGGFAVLGAQVAHLTDRVERLEGS